MLSIIVPIYNEEKTLEKVFSSVSEAMNGENYEIIFVNDGSTDKTREIISNIKNSFPDILQNNKISQIHHDKNYGKGKAIRSGLLKATGEYITIQDADLEYDPRNLYELYKIAREKQAVIYGKRSNKRKGEKGYVLARLGNKILSHVCNMLFSSKMSDIYTCYKIIPRKLMVSLDLQSNGFEIEAEITAKILKRKILITEIPISYKPRTFSQGKKINWRDGYKGIIKLMEIYAEK